MPKAQQLKSERTRNELFKAMVSLFIEKGFEDTTVKEITTRAGYAVGSFYRHWEGKQEAFMDFWDGYLSDFIGESVKQAPLEASVKEMAGYLVRRSELFGKNEITIKLFAAGRLAAAMSGSSVVDDMSKQYHEMLYQYVKKINGSVDEERLKSITALLHTMLDAHAMQYADAAQKIDNDTMKEAVEAVMMLSA